MDYSSRILGSHTANILRARGTTPILVIGSDTFDRTVLSGVKCFNFNAASSLSRILTKELKVKNTRDLFENVSPTDLVLPRIGAVALAVLGACFEAKHVGGSNPLEAWSKNHRTDEVRDFVTFDTMKAREHRETTKTVRQAHKKPTRKNTANLRAVARKAIAS